MSRENKRVRFDKCTLFSRQSCGLTIEPNGTRRGHSPPARFSFSQPRRETPSHRAGTMPAKSHAPLTLNIVRECRFRRKPRIGHAFRESRNSPSHRPMGRGAGVRGTVGQCVRTTRSRTMPTGRAPHRPHRDGLRHPGQCLAARTPLLLGDQRRIQVHFGIESRSTCSTDPAGGEDAAAGGQGCGPWTTLPGFDNSIAMA